MAAHNEEHFQQWLQSGDFRQAASWMVQRYADEMIGFCTSMVRDKNAAEDLVQDVFSRAFTGLAGFRADASSRTWLYQIAKNRCIDHLKAQNRRVANEPDEDMEPDLLADDQPLPADLLNRKDEVEAALDALTENDRALIVLRFRNGLSYGELALAFGLKDGTTRMRVSRALSRMRERLEARAKSDLPAAAGMAIGTPEFDGLPFEAEETLGVDDELIADTQPLTVALDEDGFDLEIDQTLDEADHDDTDLESDELLGDDANDSAMADLSAPTPLTRSSVSLGADHVSNKRDPSSLAGVLNEAWGSPDAPAVVEHPLTAYFLVTMDGASAQLRTHLLEQAASL